MATIDELAAALNNHQVTDDDGQIVSESAPEQVDNLESESEVENEEDVAPKLPDQDPDEAEDEQGRKYVPLKRLDKVWRQKKDLERELAALRQTVSTETPKAPVALDRTQALEMEILFDKHPEFDPTDSRYSVELDTLAGRLVKANPSLSPLQAAREAKQFAKQIGDKRAGIQSESIMVKRTVSDNGMVGRPQKVSSTPDIDIATASAEDMERYLKQTGNW